MQDSFLIDKNSILTINTHSECCFAIVKTFDVLIANLRHQIFTMRKSTCKISINEKFQCFWFSPKTLNFFYAYNACRSLARLVTNLFACLKPKALDGCFFKITLSQT
jgi:hypothetical protein